MKLFLLVLGVALVSLGGILSHNHSIWSLISSISGGGIVGYASIMREKS